MYKLTFSLTRESGDLCEKTLEVLEDEEGQDVSIKKAIAAYMTPVGLWVASQILPHDGFGSFTVKNEEGEVVHGPVTSLQFVVGVGDRRAG